MTEDKNYTSDDLITVQSWCRVDTVPNRVRWRLARSGTQPRASEHSRRHVRGQEQVSYMVSDRARKDKWPSGVGSRMDYL